MKNKLLRTRWVEGDPVATGDTNSSPGAVAFSAFSDRKNCSQSTLALVSFSPGDTTSTVYASMELAELSLSAKIQGVCSFLFNANLMHKITFWFGKSQIQTPQLSRLRQELQVPAQPVRIGLDVKFCTFQLWFQIVPTAPLQGILYD